MAAVRRAWTVAAVISVVATAAALLPMGAASAADGDRTPGFGTSGLVEYADGQFTAAGRRVVPYGVREDEAGNLIVSAAVETDTATAGGLVVRLRHDGTLDTSFGTAGALALAGAPAGVASLLDGRYLVGQHNAWQRVTAGGATDPSFRAAPVVTDLLDLIAMPDGRTLAVGTNQLVAVDVNGAPDPSFSATTALTQAGVTLIGAAALADDGRVLVASYAGAGGADECRVVALDGHGQLDAGYGAAGSAVPQAEGAPMTSCVVAFGADGSAAAGWFDSTGVSGVISVLGPTGTAVWARTDRSPNIVGDGRLAFDGAGRVVEATMDPAQGTTTISRLETDGRDDLSFGGGPSVTLSGPHHLDNPSVAVLPSGGIVATGDAYDTAGSTHVGLWLASLSSLAGIGPEVPLRSTTAFVPLAPTRLLDTRIGVGAPATRPGAGGVVDLLVGGTPSVPADAVAVVLNVTATDSAGPGFVTVWPSGGRLPLVSNLNLERAGQTVANLVTVSLGGGGRVSLYTLSPANLIADVAGYYRRAESATAGRFVPAAAPTRLLDTRTGVGAPAALPGAGAVVDVQVTGAGPVPATGVSAVVLNLTGVDASAVGYVTAWPTGAARPVASNLNLAARDVRANLVVVPVGAGGRVSLFTQSGTHLVADVTGWFTDSSAADDVHGLFVPVPPRRMLDTRLLPAGALPAAGVESRRVGATSVVPPSFAGAVVANVTVTEPTAPGYITAWPGGTTRPVASNLNVVRGQTVANLTMVGLGDEAVTFFTQSSAHLIVDVSGWFVA